MLYDYIDFFLSLVHTDFAAFKEIFIKDKSKCFMITISSLVQLRLCLVQINIK